MCAWMCVYIYRCRTSNVAITKIYTSSYSEILHCVTIIFSLILIIFIENSEKKCILCAWLYFAVMSYPFCNYNWWFCVSACVWLCPDVLSELCMTTVRMHKRTFFWAHERIFLFIMDTIYWQKNVNRYNLQSIVWFEKKRLRCSTYNFKKKPWKWRKINHLVFFCLCRCCVFFFAVQMCACMWRCEKKNVYICVSECLCVCVVRMCTILYLSLSILYEWALQIKSKHTKESKWRQQIKWKKKNKLEERQRSW